MSWKSTHDFVRNNVEQGSVNHCALSLYLMGREKFAFYVQNWMEFWDNLGIMSAADVAKYLLWQVGKFSQWTLASKDFLITNWRIYFEIFERFTLHCIIPFMLGKLAVNAERQLVRAHGTNLKMWQINSPVGRGLTIHVVVPIAHTKLLIETRLIGAHVRDSASVFIAQVKNLEIVF